MKIIDFGLAMQWRSNLDRPSPLHKGREDARDLIYPKAYRAPELWSGDRYYDEKVDIWAIGVIFIWMVTKKLVFDAPPGKHISVIAGRFPVNFKNWANQ